MLREAGTSPPLLIPVRLPDLSMAVKRFAVDVVGPKVREMDENESMDPEIIKGLFDQGVSNELELDQTPLTTRISDLLLVTVLPQLPTTPGFRWCH